MGGNRYYQNITTHTINIGAQPSHKRRDRNEQNLFFLISESRGGQIYIDLEKFPKFIRFLEDLSRINEIEEKDKQVDFSEYIRGYRRYISDFSKDYCYEFRITEKEETRNVSSAIYIKGITQLNLIKETTIELHDKYQNDKWLDEKIRSDGEKYVEVNGKKIEVEKKYGRLQLTNLGIKNISDIKGLEDILYLKILNLNNNEIEEIKDLDHLVYLQRLYLGRNRIKNITGLDKLKNLEELSFNFNPISSLNGLETFENLVQLSLEGTRIPKEIFKEAGIEDPTRAQEILKFIKNKENASKKYEVVKSTTIEYIKKASSIFEEITFSKIRSKTGIEIHDLEEIVEDLIFSGKIKAKIRKDGIVFIEENPLIGIALETVDVLHEIKDDTELISLYTSYIEDVFDKTENIEEFLKSHLASEFEKIRNAWQDYKEGKIEKKEFIKTGIKEIGKKFVKIFIKKI